MPTIEKLLSSLRLRIETLKARKPIPKQRNAVSTAQRRETGEISERSMERQFLDPRVEFVYLTYCKNKNTFRTVVRNFFEVPMKTLWDEFKRIDFQTHYHISRTIEQQRDFSINLDIALENHKNNKDIQRIQYALHDFFNLMLFYVVLYQIFDQDIAVVKASFTDRLLLLYKVSNSLFSPILNTAFEFMCEQDSVAKNQLKLEFNHRFRDFYNIPRNLSVREWAAAQAVSGS